MERELNSTATSQARMIKKLCKACQQEFETPELIEHLLGRTIDMTRSRCPSCHDAALADRAAKEREAEEAQRREHIEKVTARWHTECGIPFRFVSKTFENFDPKDNRTAYSVARSFALAYAYGDTHSLSSLYLYSVKPEIGIGKTHLAAAIGNQIISQWAGQGTTATPFFFTTEREFLLRLRASFSHHNDFEHRHETEDEIYDQLSKVPLLILDELGNEETDRGGTSSAFVRKAYAQVIGGRYDAQLPTVITSNFAPSDLTGYLGQTLQERIVEMTWKHVVRMRGKTRRIPAGKENA